MNAKVKPFLKWAGGKSQLLDCIRKLYPVGLGSSIYKYAEPFLGGGAVLFDLLSNYDLKDIYISDINRELIHTYLSLRDNTDELLRALRFLESEFLSANDDKRRDIYYSSRARFNLLKSTNSFSIELASLFIFLNKTCFNGLYRVNSRAAFNVPQGRYKNPTICDENNLRAVADKLQGVTIVCADYRDSSFFIDCNTFVYFDPPYRPLSASANFSAYADSPFGDNEQVDLAAFIDALSERGAKIIASNSDPKNYDASDDFFDRLYSRHSIARIAASRTINSVPSLRGKITELLIAT